MRHYDGSYKWRQIEAGLHRDGFVLEFGTSYDMSLPKDLKINRFADGWEIRRAIKAWCAKHGVTDFKIVRNTSFHRDLHGVVYQLWARGFDRHADYIRMIKKD